ncbi:hypothetical protein G6514_005608 [Epicoccum nigrum]|nr:hypothetical protein G6514_005608 [Epicoccum nigrum]
MVKATTDSGQKMILADCVAVLLMSYPSVAKDTYDMMSAVDSTRTASSFEHQFRSVVARARELKKRVEDGETFSPVTAPKRGATTTPATPASGKKRKGDDADDTPSKKTKAASKPRDKKAAASTPADPPAGGAFDHDDLPADMDDFIKSEKKWEEENEV